MPGAEQTYPCRGLSCVPCELSRCAESYSSGGSKRTLEGPSRRIRRRPSHLVGSIRAPLPAQEPVGACLARGATYLPRATPRGRGTRTTRLGTPCLRTPPPRLALSVTCEPRRRPARMDAGSLLCDVPSTAGTTTSSVLKCHRWPSKRVGGICRERGLVAQPAIGSRQSERFAACRSGFGPRATAPSRGSIITGTSRQASRMERGRASRTRRTMWTTDGWRNGSAARRLWARTRRWMVSQASCRRGPDTCGR